LDRLGVAWFAQPLKGKGGERASSANLRNRQHLQQLLPLEQGTLEHHGSIQALATL
jgi:hypothetical protein